ncbi:MAG: hypothetical protein K2N09_03395, partial [Muribaculaceae bacterium]|nr:hypothetical protein [Muribaculaceae bacterium]
MEEKEDIIYDIEGIGPHTPQTEDAEAPGALEEPGSSDNSEIPDSPEESEGSGNSEGLEVSADDDGSDSPAMEEIRRMAGEMGADTLLEIIRDNRNAAIRQIISEVEASRPKDLPSGVSGRQKCSS